MDNSTRRGIPEPPTIPTHIDATERMSRRMSGQENAKRYRYTLRAAAVGIGAALVFVLMLSLLLAVGMFAYIHTLNLILPGVRVGEVELGGMTVDEAANAINASLNVTDRITIAVEDRSWQVSPAEFGITVDSAATAVRAAAVGRGESPITEAFQMLNAALSGRSVDLVVVLDREKSREALTRWAATINVPPQDARLNIDNGALIAVPGRQGYALDVDATLVALAADPAAALRNGYLPLVLTPTAPNVPNASAALGQAQTLTAAPLTITFYDAITDEQIEKTVQPSDIAGWLSVQPDNKSLNVIVDPAKVAAHLRQISGTLGEGREIDTARIAPVVIDALKAGKPAFVMISHLPTDYTVQPGDTLTSIAWKVGMPYWRILDANPGLDANAINAGQVLTIPSKDILLPLPVIPDKRLILSIGSQQVSGYENHQRVFTYVISTGIDRSPTQPGVFQVQSHELNAYASIWDLYMPHFLGIYEAWPGFMNGFHGLPLLHGGVRLWGDVLGHPASFGCIILSLQDAETLYNWAPDGVVVEIRE